MDTALPFPPRTPPRRLASALLVGGLAFVMAGLLLTSLTRPAAAQTGPVVTITKTDNRDTAFPQDHLDYRITLRNTGDELVTRSQLVDRLPAEVDLFLPSMAPPAIFDPLNRTITWRNIGIPANGLAYVYRFRATVKAKTPAGSVVQNAVELQGPVTAQASDTTTVVPRPTPSPSPTPTPTPTPSPSPTPTPSPTPSPTPTPTPTPSPSPTPTPSPSPSPTPSPTPTPTATPTPSPSPTPQVLGATAGPPSRPQPVVLGVETGSMGAPLFLTVGGLLTSAGALLLVRSQRR